MGKGLISRKISFGFIAGITSIGIDGIAGLIVLPMLIKFLSEEIAGIWLFFISFTVLIRLGQAGLAPVVTRISAKLKSTYPSLEVNNSIWATVKWSYSIATLLVILICSVIYVFYIYFVLKEQNFIFQGTLCWLLLSVSFMLRIYFIKYFHLINGFGEVGWDKFIQIFIALINLIGFYFVLKLDFGFWSLGAVYLLSGIIFSFFAKTTFNRLNKGYIITKSSYTTVKEVMSMFSESGKILMLNITSFIVLQSNFFVIERLIGLEVIPYYAGLQRVTTLILAVSGMVTTMMYPFISQKFAQNDVNGMLQLVKRNVVISLSVATLLSVVVFIAAPILFPLWLGEGSYLGANIFGPMLILVVLYVNHNAFANSIIATGANTFIIPAIINACLTLPLSIFGGIQYGLQGIVVANLIALVLPSFYVVVWSIKYLKALKLNYND
ncbi:Na+-driven multidrug efflux pump [Polaribacter sp. Hel1_33_78]|uniref:lipopolysaccharide biosynthesis protein n=1 Tax=Polaribacter sp. Hel1_33_78 TaxID=1336804 RepID=UPI00087D116D|nr:hypothetical protein [Polaribacter sp. Hel1_33_78]SDT95172.1 Na+-driven multidrug efflux pump [Polaribacter sp. Hel1_33_78]